MPIFVIHDQPGALAGVAQNVSAFDTQRRLNAEGLQQQQFGLQQQQFGADVSFRRAQLQQQAQEAMYRARLAQQQLDQEGQQFNDQIRSRFDLEQLQQQGDLQRADLQGQYAVNRADVTGQYGLDRANAAGQYGLDRTAMVQQGQNQRLDTRGQQQTVLQDDQQAARENLNLQQFGNQTALSAQRDEYMQRRLDDQQQFQQEQQGRQFVQQNVGREDTQQYQAGMQGQRMDAQQAAQEQRSAAMEQRRIDTIRQRLMSSIDSKQRLVLQAQQAAPDQVPSLAEDLARARQALTQFESALKTVGPPSAEPPMRPAMQSSPGYGMQAGPPAGGAQQVGQTVPMPDGTLMRVVGYDPATGEPLVVPAR